MPPRQTVFGVGAVARLLLIRNDVRITLVNWKLPLIAPVLFESDEPLCEFRLASVDYVSLQKMGNE